MEQKISVDASSEKLDYSSNSPPQKRAKRQPEEKSSPSETTSNDAAIIAGNLNGANAVSNQQLATPLTETHPAVVRGLPTKKFLPECVNENSSTERRS